MKVLRIPKFNADDLASLASASLSRKLPKLENLDLSENNLANTLDYFCCEAFPSLENLKMRNANLNATDVVSLGVAIRNGNFPKLENLDPQDNNFFECPAAVETLIKLCTENPKQPALTLNLSNTKIGFEFRSKILHRYVSQSLHTHVPVFICI